ncbi:hypothetical protein VNO77_17738 [Canavalia gladiata]|uniref:Uncharacterized protein n=1 Tax=Canavalia gladiata TaxID=3824 RepID=A0AAN9QJM5_CANGL
MGIFFLPLTSPSSHCSGDSWKFCGVYACNRSVQIALNEREQKFFPNAEYNHCSTLTFEYLTRFLLLVIKYRTFHLQNHSDFIPKAPRKGRWCRVQITFDDLLQRVQIIATGADVSSVDLDSIN